MSKRFRTGAINPAGGKPLTPLSKTYKCVTATQWLNSGGTAGDHGVIIPCNYNVPLRLTSTQTFAVPIGISSNRHPSGHSHIVADGYNTYLVKDAHLRIDASFHGSNSPDNWIMAYKFNTDGSAGLPNFTASVVTTEIWLDLQASSGWVWQRYGCDRTGDRKTHGVTNIKMNNLPALTIASQANTSTAQFTHDDLMGVIESGTASPAVVTFLHIMIFRIKQSGIVTAFGTSDVMLSLRMTQNVKVWQKQNQEELIDNGADI